MTAAKAPASFALREETDSPVAGSSSLMVSAASHSEVLKVSNHSRPSAVAGAIAGVIREHGTAEIQSIGAGATNQAIKAIAIASSYLDQDEIRIVCSPSFIDVEIDDQERTAIRLIVERR